VFLQKRLQAIENKELHRQKESKERKRVRKLLKTQAHSRKERNTEGTELGAPLEDRGKQKAREGSAPGQRRCLLEQSGCGKSNS
jgi:hypothetical protein